MIHLPTLYKKTSTGAIQSWRIYVLDQRGSDTAATIYTEHGQVDGKIQQTSEHITEGKNIGKKNETTPKEQAVKEAKARWEKQKKKGYVETIEKAQAEEVDDIIEGGIVPMLAHKYTDHGHKIKYPAFAQPKLDGIRCIAIVKDGECTLWSRTRKPITAVPHIQMELEAAFPTGVIVLDGELYNHDYRNNFEKIVSLVRQEEPDPEHHLVQYHIYDIASEGTFKERFERFQELFSHYEDAFTSLFLVTTTTVSSEDGVSNLFEKAREMGFEGIILRNADSEYVNKRSYDLQKVKEFDDAEFQIIGIEEGRGKLAGHVGAFKCKMDNGTEFLAKAKGETANLKKYFENHSLWEGKKLTVQYQGLTGAQKVPRFPVGIAIRDYE